jgi:uncharacterized protein involved in outer membrane biogenesis
MIWRPSFTTTSITEKIQRPWVRKTGFSLLGLLCVFVLFSLSLFFAGPSLIKSYLTDSLSQKLGRKVSVGAVRINPFVLSVAIDDFSMAEPDGKTPFITFKRYYVNVQLASVMFGGPVLSEIHLMEPRVNLVRMADNAYNFQDIIERLSKKPSDQQQKASKPMGFSLNNIRINKGLIKFDDRPKGRRHEIRDLNISIPFLSNLFYRVNDYIDPAFSAIVNGAPFRLTGKSKPFEADRETSLNLKLNRLGLNDYLTYVPKILYFTLPGGTLDADIKIAFVQSKDKVPTLRLSGSAALNNLALNEATDMPTIRLKSLHVVLENIEPLVKRFTVNRITVGELELFVRRNSQGRLNLANLVEPSDKEEPLPYFLVREIVLNASIVHVRDEQRERPFETSFHDIHLVVRNLTSEKGKTGQVEITASGTEIASLKAAADIVLEPLAVNKLNVKLADLRLLQPGSKTDMVRIGRFDIDGGAFELDRRHVAIDEISLANSRFNIQRNRKGVLNLSDIVGGSGETAGVKADTAPPAPPLAVRGEESGPG